MTTPTVGQNVFHAMKDGSARPAKVVRVNDDGTCDLVVFVLGAADYGLIEHTDRERAQCDAPTLVARMGVREDATKGAPNTWRATEALQAPPAKPAGSAGAISPTSPLAAAK